MCVRVRGSVCRLALATARSAEAEATFLTFLCAFHARVASHASLPQPQSSAACPLPACCLLPVSLPYLVVYIVAVVTGLSCCCCCC